MTHNEMAKFVGREVQLKTHDLRVEAIITDMKLVYGQHRFLIKPITGHGETWVSRSALIIRD